MKRSAAGSARQLAINGLGASFDFDNLIERVAVRAIERWFTGRHDTPPHLASALYQPPRDCREHHTGSWPVLSPQESMWGRIGNGTTDRVRKVTYRDIF